MSTLEANTHRSLTLFVSSHFMFNVLGKLQSEILSNDKIQAITTLSNYSKLIRMAYNISHQKIISLNTEKNFIELYVNLEQDRFIDSPFKYSIIGFEILNISLPPFILQPCLELAILQSLGLKANHVYIEYISIRNEVKITSELNNEEISESLNEKLQIFKERLFLLKLNYTSERIKNVHTQIIKLIE